MPVEIFRLSFRVFSCACPAVTSSTFGKRFHFPFPYFVLTFNRLFIVVDDDLDVIEDFKLLGSMITCIAIAVHHQNEE